MSSTLLVLVLWYVPGAAVAWLMVRRGHQPSRWIYAAWIGGPLALVPALVTVLRTPAPPPGPDGPTLPAEPSAPSDHRIPG